VKWEPEFPDVVQGVEPFAHISPVLDEWARDPRLWNPSKDVIGQDAIALFTEKLTMKRAHTGGTIVLHQPGDVQRSIAREGRTKYQAICVAPTAVLGATRMQSVLAADDPRSAPFHRLHDAVAAGAERFTLECLLAEALGAMAAFPDVRDLHSRPVRRALEVVRERYADAAARVRFFDQLLPRLQALPGVTQVAIASNAPGLGAGGRRIEIEQSQINIDSTKINLVAIKNGLKPTLQVFAELTNNGLSGDMNALAPPGAIDSIPYLTGGYSNVLAQILRRNFPSYSAGFSLNIPLRNRAAQADYATSALSLRQNELALQKSINQVRVDVQNAVIGLRQARVRYDSSVKARILQQQNLDADRKKYALGASTVFQVVTDQQTLAAAQSAEQQALANYSHAHIAFDQAMGTTLDINNISIDEALSGHVAKQSVLPAVLPSETTPTTPQGPKQ